MIELNHAKFQVDISRLQSMYSLGVNSYQPIDPCCLGMPGVSGPLVDDEGFPRGDIDLYAVRQARNKYVCAQTDHIEIMRKIEQAGH